MINIANKYQNAKNKANNFMNQGLISQYFEALLEMNEYKKLMNAIIAN